MKMETELNELKAENTTLKETLAVLHENKIQCDKQVKQYEKQYGVEGLSKMITGINELIETNEQIDAIKGKSLLEMSAIVQQLSQKIEEIRNVIKPHTEEFKTLKNVVAQMEPQYKEEKAVFDGITSDAKAALDEAKDSYVKVKNEVYAIDSKIDTLVHQTQVVKVMQDM